MNEFKATIIELFPHDYMYLILENTNKSFSFPKSRTLMVGNDSDCDVQINHPKIWGKHFIVNQQDYGCVLEVLTDCVIVNGKKIIEKCMLDTGDAIQVEEIFFRLLDDSFIPKDSQLNHTNVKLNNEPNTSSVYGIRSFSEDSMGQFVIDNFHHTDGWHVFRKNEELHFIDNKHKSLLNGLKIAQALLSNGDTISGPSYKYKIELPGTSGFSKFSPSHPRNVLLSESVAGQTDELESEAPKSGGGFFKRNLWWLTLLSGLVVLILVIINNPGR